MTPPHDHLLWISYLVGALNVAAAASVWFVYSLRFAHIVHTWSNSRPWPLLIAMTANAIKVSVYFLGASCGDFFIIMSLPLSTRRMDRWH